MNFYNKHFIWLACFIILFNSCKFDSPASKDNSLDIRMAKEPEKLNAVLFPNPTAREVFQYIFLPLADYDAETQQLVPILIKSIPSPIDVIDGPYKGGVRYDFEFKDEAKWDDGKPITADDYLYTMKVIMHPGSSAGAYRGVVSNFADIVVDSTNKKKVSVFYKDFYMLAKEAVVNVDILPKHIYDPQGRLDKYNFKDFKDEKAAEALVSKDSLLVNYMKDINGIKYTKDVVVGCGPYKLSKWNANQQIVLEKKESYWAASQKTKATEQHADKIIFHFIPDEMAAITRLKNGEVDILSGLNSKNYESFISTNKDNFQYSTAQLMKTYNVLINHNDAILKSLPVRKALAHITDVDQLIKNIENGNGIRTIGSIHPAKKYYNKSIQPYAFSIDEAKKLLAADGWADSNNDGTLDKKINNKKTELNIQLFASGDLGNKIALVMQSEAKKAGIGLEIIKKEFAQVRKENIETGKFGLVLQVLSQDIGYDDLKARLHSENAELGESNYGSYKNPKVDALIDKINTVKQDSEREALFMELQQILHDDLPYIYLYCPKEKFVISKSWKGSTNMKRPGYQANTFVAQ